MSEISPSANSSDQPTALQLVIRRFMEENGMEPLPDEKIEPQPLEEAIDTPLVEEHQQQVRQLPPLKPNGTRVRIHDLGRS
jgi:hypothetical protein